MRLPTAAILTLISVTSFAQQAKTPVAPSAALTAERAVKYRRPSDLHFSADGSHLICAVSEVNGPTIESHLWLLHVGHDELHQFTFSQKSERLARWSPVSGELAFLSNRAGATQVYVMAPDAGEAQVVTASEPGVSDFRWSPDGRQIAFLAPESAHLQADSEPRIADSEQDLARLWIVDLASRKVRQLTSGDWRIDDFEWIRSNQILAMASDHPRSDAWNDALYSISSTDSAITLVAQPNQPFNKLETSPGHSQFSYVSTRNAGPIAHDLFVQSAISGAARDITSRIDRAVLQTRWQNETTVLVRVADGFRNRVFRTNLSGIAVAIDLPYSVRDFDVRRDGTLAFTAVGFNRLPEVFVRRTDGILTQVSHL
jgi:dipeptidyl aminopeptidase/acylaminoacyl peptidase